MKKILVLVLASIVLTGCGVMGDTNDYSDDYIKSCYDLGGLMSEDGCVLCGDTCGDKTPPAETPADNTCEVKLADMGAPADTIAAICNGTYGEVSQRLTSGTEVQVGTLTFDNEYRVWFLLDWRVPSKANYSFSYKGAEKNFFDAPFVLGSELGYKNGERVPFEICWDTVSPECKLPDGVAIN